MEEQEKLDIINKRLSSRPDNWKWNSDYKSFGWDMQRKNRRRKSALNFIQRIKRKITKGLDLTEEEVVQSQWYPQLKRIVKWHIAN